MKYAVIPRYLPAPSKRRPCIQMNKVVFIVVHDTGNANSTAAQNVKYYESSRDSMEASAHLFVDDKDILECIPALTAPVEKAWHVRYNVPYDNEKFGVNANDAAIGVELCYATDGSINNEEAYKRYVWVLAYICARFNLNPASSIVAHEHLDPTRRNDPSTALEKMNRTFQNLIEDVVWEYHSIGNTVDHSTIEDGIGVATIIVECLNVRTRPDINSSVIKVVSQGEAYKVYYEQDGWYNVGEDEWICAHPEYVAFTLNHMPTQQTGVAKILVDALRVRTQPSIHAPVVKMVHKGETYKVYGEENGWYNVGDNEWISANAEYVSFRSDL